MPETFKSETRTVKIVAYIGIVGLLLMYRCAKQLQEAPQYCKSMCEANNSRYVGWDTKFEVIIECTCARTQ